MSQDHRPIANAIWSNTLSTVWGIVAISAIALVALPVDVDFAWALGLVLALTLLGCVIFRRFWPQIAVGGFVVTFAVTAVLPLIARPENAYFIRCDNVTRCLRTLETSDSGASAKIYLVADPIKWAFWTWAFRNADDARIVEQSALSDGRLVFHAPTERALVRASRLETDRASTKVYLPSLIDTLSADFGRTPNSDEVFNLGYATRYGDLLSWDASPLITSPGVFSSLGPADEIEELAREVVRADLQARALIDGAWRSVMVSIDRAGDRSARAIARDRLLENALVDTTHDGRLLSLQRLLALRETLPVVDAFAENSPPGDMLMRVLIDRTFAMVRMPTGLPGREARLSNEDPRELRLFDRELAWIFTQWSAQQIGDNASNAAVRSRGRELYEAWIAAVMQPEGRERFLDGWREGVVQGDDIQRGPFLRDTFTIDNLRTALEGQRDQGVVDSHIYWAARILRSRAGVEQMEVMSTMLRSQSTDSADLQELAARMRDITRRTVETSAAFEPYLAQASPALRQQVRALLAQNSDPSWNDIIGLIARMPSLPPEQQTSIMPFYFLAITRGDPGMRRLMLSIMEERPLAEPRPSQTCAWYDRSLRTQFVTHVVMVMHDNMESRERMADPLWAAYGARGRCPNYVPGLMLTHATMITTGDPRTARTRGQIDRLVGADAGWIGSLAQEFREPRIYEGLPRAERFFAQPD